MSCENQNLKTLTPAELDGYLKFHKDQKANAQQISYLTGLSIATALEMPIPLAGSYIHEPTRHQVRIDALQSEINSRKTPRVK